MLCILPRTGCKMYSSEISLPYFVVSALSLKIKRF